MLKRMKRYIKPVMQSPIWMTIFADMTTNLMLFFLMLFIFLHQRFVTQDTPGIELVRAEKIMEESTIEQLGRKFAEKEIKIDVGDEKIRILVGSKVLFDLGRAGLKQEAEDILNRIAPQLLLLKNQIIIEGHTDNLPIRSESEYKSNWDLSAARARSVEKYLERIVSKHIRTERKLEEFLSRIQIACYGKYRPIASNKTPEGRAKNRRIEIVIKRFTEK